LASRTEDKGPLSGGLETTDGVGVTMVVPANVDLTFDRNDGIRPGSGSSENGLGKVVRAATVEGLVEGGRSR
jgi:hypothetical protein